MRLSEQLRELYPVSLRDTAGPIFYIQGKAVNVNTLIAQACHLEQQAARVESAEIKLAERPRNYVTEVHSAFPRSMMDK